MPYRWDTALRRYVDGKGNPVGETQIRDWVKESVESAAGKLEDLARQHQKGEINRPDWVTRAGDELKNMHRAVAMIAHGGREQMTPKEWGQVGQVLRREYGYLNAFVNELDNLPDDPKLGQAFIARARSYASAGYSTYENSIRSRERDAGREFEILVLGAAEHCPDCLSDAAQGEVPIGTLAPIGSRQCISNCRCHFEYSGGDFLDKTPADVKVKFEKGAKALAKRLFGEMPSSLDIARIAGAIDKAKVTVHTFGGELFLEVRHPDLESMHRYVRQDSRGRLMIENGSFITRKDAPKGIGLTSFLTQVGGAKKLGVNYVKLDAVGTPLDPDFNGYYTWPRFGFEGRLRQIEIDELPDNLKSARTLNQLMMLPGGPEWWKARGSNIEVKFSLDDDSTSMRVLRSYVTEKRKRKRGG